MTTRTASRARRTLAGITVLGVATVSSGCGAQPGTDVALDYWLWDSNQLIPYQQCIDRFEEQNPDITVRVSQYGFDDYWTKPIDIAGMWAALEKLLP